MNRLPIKIDTKYGKRIHGYLYGDKFVRSGLSYERDRMRNLDAWSIHPDVLKELPEYRVTELVFIDENTRWSIEVEKAQSVGFSKDNLSASFGGGETFYIPCKHWRKEPRKQKGVSR